MNEIYSKYNNNFLINKAVEIYVKKLLESY